MSTSMRKMPHRQWKPVSPRPEENKEKQSCCDLEVARKVVELCIQFAVFVTVLYFQIKNRPTQADVYHTDDPWDTSRGGVTYACGCSLPASLGLESDPYGKPETSLNICYERSSLETVKVLTYSYSAAEEINGIIKTVSPEKLRTIYTKTVREGYTVTQEAYDLYGSITTWNPVRRGLEGLYIGGYKQPNVNLPLEYLQSEEFLSFPSSYVRLYFQYLCNSCALCGPHAVNTITNEVSNNDEGWASCFRWEIEQQEGQLKKESTCKEKESFYGKCLLYPTETLPANFAIKTFLDKFLNLPGIDRSLEIYTRTGDGVRLKNRTFLQPSQLYLNISNVKKSSIKLSFLEVSESSVLWALLLNYFPTLDDECADMRPIKVCSGTSVCNVFTNANSEYDSKCLDMNDTVQCNRLMTDGGTGNSSVDNTSKSDIWSRLKVNSWLELLCPEFKCESEKVLPYFVKWETSDEVKNDTLNRFLAFRILKEKWARQSGVCTKTYRHVYRPPAALVPEAAKDDRETMLLQSNCTWNMISNQTGTGRYCWLTGRYRTINDAPTDSWHTLDLPASHDRFVCYTIKTQGFGSWFITTVGILFGWVGTVDLLLKWFVKLIRRIQTWTQDRKRKSTTLRNPSNSP